MKPSTASAPAASTPHPKVVPNMRVNELKDLVSTRGYAIDCDAVAEALLRRTDPRRGPVLLPPVSRPRARSRTARAGVIRRRPCPAGGPYTS